jgi:hypothetical protein
MLKKIPNFRSHAARIARKERGKIYDVADKEPEEIRDMLETGSFMTVVSSI